MVFERLQAVVDGSVTVESAPLSRGGGRRWVITFRADTLQIPAIANLEVTADAGQLRGAHPVISVRPLFDGTMLMMRPASCAPGYVAALSTNYSGYSGGCLPCPPGSYSTEIGSLQCQRCPPGYEQPLEGQQMCTPCPRGSFTPVGDGHAKCGGRANILANCTFHNWV